MSQTHIATLIGSISIVLWGTLALFTSLTQSAHIPPFQLLAMSFSIAFLLMCGKWWWYGNKPSIWLKQPLKVWLLGVSGYFIYHALYFFAMSQAPAAEVSLIAYLWPLFIVILAGFLPNESLQMRAVWGALLALAGCWLLIAKADMGVDPQYMPGYIAAFACALVWSSFSVLSRLLKQVPTDVVGWFCLVTALLGLMAHLIWEATILPQTWVHWVGIIGLGVGPVGIAFFTWDYGVKKGNLSLLGVLAYFTPLISTLFLVLAGEAEASWKLLLACIAIVGGALIASWKIKSATE